MLILNGGDEDGVIYVYRPIQCKIFWLKAESRLSKLIDMSKEYSSPRYVCDKGERRHHKFCKRKVQKEQIRDKFLAPLLTGGLIFA